MHCSSHPSNSIAAPGIQQYTRRSEMEFHKFNNTTESHTQILQKHSSGSLVWPGLMAVGPCIYLCWKFPNYHQHCFKTNKAWKTFPNSDEHTTMLPRPSRPTQYTPHCTVTLHHATGRDPEKRAAATKTTTATDSKYDGARAISSSVCGSSIEGGTERQQPSSHHNAEENRSRGKPQPKYYVLQQLAALYVSPYIIHLTWTASTSAWKQSLLSLLWPVPGMRPNKTQLTESSAADPCRSSHLKLFMRTHLFGSTRMGWPFLWTTPFLCRDFFCGGTYYTCLPTATSLTISRYLAVCIFNVPTSATRVPVHVTCFQMCRYLQVGGCFILDKMPQFMLLLKRIIRDWMVSGKELNLNFMITSWQSDRQGDNWNAFVAAEGIIQCKLSNCGLLRDPFQSADFYFISGWGGIVSAEKNFNGSI